MITITDPEIKKLFIGKDIYLITGTKTGHTGNIYPFGVTFNLTEKIARSRLSIRVSAQFYYHTMEDYFNGVHNN